MIAAKGGTACRRRLRGAWRIVDLILHIGVHRTATTTFQLYLGRHRRALAEAGVALWLPADVRRSLLDGIIHRPEDADPEIDRRAGRNAVRLLADVEQARAAGWRQLLLTEENLSGALRGNLRDGALYADIAPRIARLGQAVLAQVTRVGLAVRRYDSYWASAMAFALRQGVALPGLADKPAQLARLPRRWPDVVADLAALLPRAEIGVWTFEDLAAQPHRQLSLLTNGTAVAAPRVGLRHNASPTALQLRALLSARGEDAAALIPAEDRAWMPFDADQRAAMGAAYRADLARIALCAGPNVRLLANTGTPLNQTSAAGAMRPRSAPPEGGRHHGQQGYVA